MNDIIRQGLSEPDRAGQTAYNQGGQMSGQDRPHKVEPHLTLDLYDVASLFDKAGLPRNRRSLSRYCTHNKLDCEKVETLNGEEWRVDEQSVHRLIAQIRQQERMTHQDRSGQTQLGHPSEIGLAESRTETAHVPTQPDITDTQNLAISSNHGEDMSGQAKTEDDKQEPASGNDERLLQQLKRENDLLRNQLDKKDQQIEKKDKQIDDLIERGREDKFLIHNFQRRLGMLAAPEQPHHPDQDNLSDNWPSVDNSSNHAPDGML